MIRLALLLLLALSANACASNYEEVRRAAQEKTRQQTQAPLPAPAQTRQAPKARPSAIKATPLAPVQAVAAAPAQAVAAAPAPFASTPVTVDPEIVPEGQVKVGQGETLYALSRRLNIEVGDLVRANALEPPYSIRAGQALIVPAARYHRVRARETAYAISRAYQVDLTLLVRMNMIEPPYAVRLGQRLKLPPVLTVEQRASQFTVAIPDQDSQAAAAAPDPQVPGAVAAATPLPAAPPFAGRFRWPVDGRVVSRFGPKAGGLFNDGINIAAPMNTPVRAAAPGVVAYVGDRLSAFGNLLLIKHGDGWVTAYAHCAEILVKRGDTVSGGEIVARVGRTGVIDSPQLHFEVRQGRKAVDPLSLLPRIASTPLAKQG